MSVARGFGLNGKSTYTNVAMPKEVWCNFIVDSTNGNGLGIRSLKSNGYVESVFMHTTQTPGSVNRFTNPNPAAGYALIRFKNNFNYYLGGFSGQIVPTITNTATSVVAGSVYVITVLGTATLAQWQAVGLLPGLTPTVGQSFVAIATQSIGGSAMVGSPGVPIAPVVTVVGDPNQSLNNSNIASNAGAQILVQFSAVTVSGTVGALTFTGSALGTHTHNFTVIGGQAASTTNNIANYAGPLIGKQEATNATYLGSASATNGGVVAISAGTPAGTINTPAFTNTSVYVATAPADSTVVGMQFCFDGSSVTIDGI